MSGRMMMLLDNLRAAEKGSGFPTLSGIGYAMEGIELEPMMYEFLNDIIWEKKGAEKDTRSSKEI